MKRDISVFIHKQLALRKKQVVDLVYFFPYFFSVKALINTFFYPWKRIITKKETRGFSFSESANRLFLNIMSSSIGMIMRFSMISFFFLFEFLFIVSLPFLALLYLVIVLPFEILMYLTQPTPEELYENQKKAFIDSHCQLKSENKQAVEQWFVSLQEHDERGLFAYPPLARDWAYGYTPTLDEYVEDLTGPSYQSITRHVVGRKKEIERIQEILAKSLEANAIVVGEEGVGKHTVVDALSRMIYDGSCHKELAYRRVLKLNMEKILTLHTDIKQRESFFESLLAEAHEAKSIILVIENIDKYCASGEGRIDLTGVIEKYAKLSTIQFIGITTPFYYQRFLFPNEKMQRLFARIDVSEISKEQALDIVLLATPDFENRFEKIIPYETVQEIITKSEFYITHIPFPEKALELLDEVCAATKDSVVLPLHVNNLLSSKTHIPTSLTDELKTKLLKLESLMNERVLFQEKAIASLSAAVRRSFILLGKRKKPLATFLFIGPTGVGKTETAKAIADLFFSSQTSLIRFDMSLYQQKSDIKTLMGSMEQGLPGLMPKTIREQPYAVLLLDELEKAHPDLLNIFLTVIDEGYFTDGYGKRVDCKNMIIIATSNAGSDYVYKQAQLLQKMNNLAHTTAKPAENTNSQTLMDYLVQNHIFSPEFLNRFDGVIEYQAIDTDSALLIAKKTVISIQNTIYSLYKIKFTLADTTLHDMIQKDFNQTFGARNLERALTQQIEDKIAVLLLENKVKEGDVITI